MADDQRAAQIARIQQIERIQSLEAKQSSGDPAQPGAQAIGSPSGPEQSLGSKAANTLQGFGQGASMGYMPQLQAITEPATTKLLDMVTGGKIAAANKKVADAGLTDKSQENDTYLNRRDDAAAAIKRAAEQNPYLFHGAQMAGALSSAALIPAGAPANATRMGKIVTGMGTGFAMGAAQNPGDTKGAIDLLQLSKRADNAETGALVGGAIPAALELPGIASPTLKKLAETQAFKALGPYARAAKQYLPGGKAQEIGRTMLDEGVVGGVPTSFQGIANRAAAAKEKAGTEVGTMLGELGSREGAPSISRADIAAQLRKELLQPEHGDVASIAQKNSTVSDLIDHFEKGGNDSIPLLDAEMKKRALDQNINWKRLPTDDVPVAEQVDKATRQKLSSSVDDKILSMDQTNGTQTGADFLKAKENYGNLSKADEIAKTKAAHELAKQLLAPGIGGTVGFAHGNTLEERLKNMGYGVAGGLALRAGQLYGPQLIAPAADAASKYGTKLSTMKTPWSLIAPANSQFIGDDNGKK